MPTWFLRGAERLSSSTAMEYGLDDDLDYAVLNRLRLDGRFCDAVICVEGIEMKAHKIVLCACSSYFRALFAGSLSNPQRRLYNIPGVSPEMMQIIIEYAYTQSVVVTKDNVERLLPAADQFFVLGIVQACADFLQAQLCTQNCVGIWRFTGVYFCPELRRAAFRFILRNFEEVSQTSEEFLELTPAELCDIIEKDELSVSQEDRVLDAVRHWTAHMPSRRRPYLPQLLSKVRIALMNADYFMDTRKTNALCKLIINFRTNMLRAMRRLRRTNFSSALWQPRLPSTVLLAIGGWSGDRPTGVVESYDTRANCWVTVAQTESVRAFHGTVCLDGFVYCMGGRNDMEFLSTVCRFDPATHGWHEVAPMNSRRCYVSVSILHGCIYAMGGFDGYTHLRCAERYEPATNQWSLIAPMNEKRNSASATTLNGKVYICGGCNGQNYLCTAECYSPDTNQWTLICPMRSQHSGLGVVAYNEEIYAVGGFDGVRQLRTVEAYDPLADRWEQMPDMIAPHSGFGIEVMDNRLFVVGGFKGLRTTFQAEYFDQMTNKWSSIQNMGVHRGGLSCCTLADIPNITEYSAPRTPGAPPLNS